jgi:hypothetical protein
MKISRILKTTPFRRFALAMAPLAVVDIVLAPISIFGGKPPFSGIVLVNAMVVFILLAKYTLLFFRRLWCKACGKGPAIDTGKDDNGCPVVRCPRCGREWIL